MLDKLVYRPTFLKWPRAHKFCNFVAIFWLHSEALRSSIRCSIPNSRSPLLPLATSPNASLAPSWKARYRPFRLLNSHLHERRQRYPRSLHWFGPCTEKLLWSMPTAVPARFGYLSVLVHSLNGHGVSTFNNNQFFIQDTYSIAAAT